MPAQHCAASQTLESDCAVQIPYSFWIFTWFLLFIIATAENSASQKCDIVEKNVAPSDV